LEVNELKDRGTAMSAEPCRLPHRARPIPWTKMSRMTAGSSGSQRSAMAE